MTTNIERAADLIATATIPPGTSIRRGTDRAILATKFLADAGLLMEDLPKPDSKGRWATELFGGGVFAIREPGVVDLVRKDGVVSNRAEVLRREALRMLAAANYAEQEQRNG